LLYNLNLEQIVGTFFYEEPAKAFYLPFVPGESKFDGLAAQLFQRPPALYKTTGH
jgi:hypothetical protein